jgi:hypothetical protein
VVPVVAVGFTVAAFLPLFVADAHLLLALHSVGGASVEDPSKEFGLDAKRLRGCEAERLQRELEEGQGREGGEEICKKK